MWQSKLGEVKSKSDWLNWGKSFYNSIGVGDLRKFKRPTGEILWGKLVKVLGLQKC